MLMVVQGSASLRAVESDTGPTAKTKKPRSAGALSRAAIRLSSGALDRHGLPVARALHGVSHDAVDEREQGVIAAETDVRAGVKLGTALAHDDRAGRNDLAAEHLDAEHLGLRVAAVAGRTA